MKAEFFQGGVPVRDWDTVAIRLAEKGGETRKHTTCRKAAWQSHREQSHCTRSQILQHFTI